MKKILAILLLAGFTLSANAEGWRHGGGHYVYRGDGMGWVVPAVIGGLIVYGATQPRQPDVVVVQQPAPLPPPTYTPPPPPYGYHWEAILDARCNCYRTVLVQNY